MKSSFEQNGGTYRQVGDYNIPNLTLPPEEANITLGKWGMLHKNYLLKHKKVVISTLLTEGKLWQYLADIDVQAWDMYDRLIEQMKATEGITEQLKEENQMEWVCRIQNIKASAREIVTTELIYT